MIVLPLLRFGKENSVEIQLSEHFTYGKLLRFVCPSIIMMIFTSIYGVVDGIFVSNFTGSESFAAVNLIMPLVMAVGALGFMLGTGGSALVAKTLGEGKTEQANQYFSMIVVVNVVAGVILSVAGILFVRPIAMKLGATGHLLEDAVLYGRIMLAGNAAFMLQNSFQSFFPVAEKAKNGLYVTVAAGLTNMLLDFLFVAVFGWGIAGAAAATVLSYFVGGILPVFYFARENTSRLRLVKTKLYGRQLLRSCANGSSEMMTNLSMSVVNMLYNIQLMHLAAENGVSAYGVIMYVNFIFAAVFLGYSIGCAPLVGYHFGAKNQGELKNLLKKSVLLVAVAQIVMTLVAEVLAPVLAGIFVSYDKDLLEMTIHGFRLFSLSFLFMGMNIFGSAFFTALNNGGISALISFLRTLVFQVAAVLILPLMLGLDGIWLAIVVAEVLALFVTAGLVIGYRKRYQYSSTAGSN